MGLIVTDSMVVLIRGSMVTLVSMVVWIIDFMVGLFNGFMVLLFLTALGKSLGEGKPRPSLARVGGIYHSF